MDIIEFRDLKPVSDPVHPYSDSLRRNCTPIVIDNGSFNCRVGWACHVKPLLVFRNVLAKPRKERGKKDLDMQIGNDITNIEAMRFLLKTQFDKNVVTHYDVQEHILSHAFARLGIDSEGSVNHPIAFTEPYMNPNYCRMMMSELLFECYSVPAVLYGVDGLLSFGNFSANWNSTGLIISIGYQCSHVIPVVNGIADKARSRRLDIGGYHIVYYMFRLMQLKYPAHVNAITLSRAEEMVHGHGRVALDYGKEISEWADADYYDANVLQIQLPQPQNAPPPPDHRRDDLRRKLSEINSRKREEKLAEDEEKLNHLMAIQDLHDEGDIDEFQTSLEESGIADTDELQKIIYQLQGRIEKTRRKIVAANTAPEEVLVDEPKSKMAKFSTPKDEEDYKMWIAEVIKKRDTILERRAARRAKRAEAARRRAPAALERMRLINQLARNDKEDDFGARDDDWDVYKAISKDGDDSGSEFGDAERLEELEGALRAAGWPADDSSRLHVATETLRAPEALFRPNLLGVDTMGLSELAAFVMSQFDDVTSRALAANIVVTGGPAALPGLIPRLSSDLVASRPFGSKVQIKIADSDPSLSAWKALRQLSGTGPYVTKEEYMEKGGEFLRTHPASNPFFPSPAPRLPEQTPSPA